MQPLSPLPAHLVQINNPLFEQKTTSFELSFVFISTAFIAVSFFKIFLSRNRGTSGISTENRVQTATVKEDTDILSSIEEEKGYEMRFFHKGLKLDVSPEMLNAQRPQEAAALNPQSYHYLKKRFGHRYVGDH